MPRIVAPLLFWLNTAIIALGVPALVLFAARTSEALGQRMAHTSDGAHGPFVWAYLATFAILAPYSYRRVRAYYSKPATAASSLNSSASRM